MTIKEARGVRDHVTTVTGARERGSRTVTAGRGSTDPAPPSHRPWGITPQVPKAVAGGPRLPHLPTTELSLRCVGKDGPGSWDRAGVTAEAPQVPHGHPLSLQPTSSFACIPHTGQSGSSDGCTCPPGAWSGRSHGQLTSLQHPACLPAFRPALLPRSKLTERCSGPKVTQHGGSA